MGTEISLAILAWMIASAAEPIQAIKRFYYLTEEFVDGSWCDWLRKLMNCSLCLGFWVGIFVTQDFYTALIISIIAEAINRLDKKTIF